MIDAYELYHAPILSTISVKDDKDYDRYGFASGQLLDSGMIDVNAIIEKPGKQGAPSDLATVSGYLLTPEIFRYMHQAANDLQPGVELFSNDALKLMLAEHKRIIACEIKNAHYHDAGDKLEYLKTVIDFALERDDIGPELTKFLRNKLQEID
jgi:UTP--glucose-1-phosphate uridylyltransferase